MSLFKKLLYFFSDDACYNNRLEKGLVKNRECHGLMGGDRSSGFLSYECQGCIYFIHPTIIQKTCETCGYHRTMECPNSSQCYSTPNKPYWIERTTKL